jgi:hypothetical protein
MTMIRPNLSQDINVLAFEQFYWTKLELIKFCRNLTLSTQGSKVELTARVIAFLTSGEKKISVLKKAKQRDSEKAPLTRHTVVIEYKSDAVTRAFFCKEIGPNFRFNADVLTWIKTKLQHKIVLTYGDIIHEWERKEQLKKDPDYQRMIPQQFQFNQFMKDWKDANAGQGAKEAWKVIRSLPGEATYAHYLEVVNQKT